MPGRFRHVAVAVAIACPAFACAGSAAAQDPYDPYGPGVIVTGQDYELDRPEVDRKTFVRRADAICGPAFHRVRGELRDGVSHLQAGEYDEAAEKITPAYRVLRTAYLRVQDLKRPPDDVERIRHWLDLKLRQLNVGIKALREYRSDDLGAASRLTERSLRLGRKSARVVAGWGFKRCV